MELKSSYQKLINLKVKSVFYPIQIQRVFRPNFQFVLRLDVVFLSDVNFCTTINKNQKTNKKAAFRQSFIESEDRRY